MKNERTKRWKASVWRCLHLLALAACLIIVVIGVVDEILGSPAWEGVLVKIGISNGWRFFWIVCACGIFLFFLTDRLRQWDPRRQPKNPDSATQERKTQ